MRLRFGVWLNPFHKPGQNPTLALQRDLQLVEHLDRLGFDEVWFGQHHSGGFELIGSPEVMIAAAAERTKRIRFGTGVISIPYHHPLVLADRLAMLDHLTRGRLIFGAGPGAHVIDAQMMGFDYGEQRRRLAEGLAAVMHLLTSDEPLTVETDWFKLRDARLQLATYQEKLEIALAAVRSPTGPRLAGQFGASLIGIAATDHQGGFDFLSQTWRIVEDEAARHGQKADRGTWRLLAPMHLARTAAQAIEEVTYGLADLLRFQSAGPFGRPGDPDVEEVLSSTDIRTLAREAGGSGYAVYGTPEMAITQVQRLWDQSGGFGTLLISVTDVAEPDAMFRSLELFAREVMPHFQGSLTRPMASWRQLYESRSNVAHEFRSAQDKAAAQYTAERIGP
ncbi:MAG: LLM class flavin-dependent oxidoreductase [Sphingomonadaceae bacterium]|nr:LLM class flavin-dependent oxidoreductase [Sphingomonadaceae bacterium]